MPRRNKEACFKWIKGISRLFFQQMIQTQLSQQCADQLQPFNADTLTLGKTVFLTGIMIWPHVCLLLVKLFFFLPVTAVKLDERDEILFLFYSHQLAIVSGLSRGRMEGWLPLFAISDWEAFCSRLLWDSINICCITATSNPRSENFCQPKDQMEFQRSSQGQPCSGGPRKNTGPNASESFS